MKLALAKLCVVCAISSFLLIACSVAKLEARLEANPQCKDVINAKTGTVMPCPGTDKGFYRSVGLEPAKASSAAISATKPNAATAGTDPSTKPVGTTSTDPGTIAIHDPPTANSPVECKPQIHKKTGGMLPCPNPD